MFQLSNATAASRCKARSTSFSLLWGHISHRMSPSAQKSTSALTEFEKEGLCRFFWNQMYVWLSLPCFRFFLPHWLEENTFALRRRQIPTGLHPLDKQDEHARVEIHGPKSFQTWRHVSMCWACVSYITLELYALWTLSLGCTGCLLKWVKLSMIGSAVRD